MGGVAAAAAALEVSNILWVNNASCVCSISNRRHTEGTAEIIVSNKMRTWLRPDTMVLLSAIASGSVQNGNYGGCSLMLK